MKDLDTSSDKEFDKQKERYMKELSSKAKDRSKKGDVDEEILPLIDVINSNPDYYTTSSCAGRIDLFVEPVSRKKYEGEWLYVSHKRIDSEAIFEALGEESDGSFKSISQETVWFRLEGAILHICCRTLESAEIFLRLCKESGWKHSGIINSFKSLSGRIIIEATTSERMDVPIAKEHELFVPKRFIGFLVKEANAKLLRTREKMARLEKAVANL